VANEETTMGLPAKKKLTVDEYLEIERAAQFKCEFFNGEMFAMSGGSLRHSLITTNVIGELRNALEGSPCRVFDSNLRLQVRKTGLFTYADAGVFCGDPEFFDGRKDVVLNPTIVIEVLSPSTEAYDRGDKFNHYRQMPSLRQYLLVTQKQARLELFTKEPNGRWTIEGAIDGLDKSIDLNSIGVTLSASRIYLNVDFDEPEAAAG
jgi:Uma2 family endonuclease